MSLLDYAEGAPLLEVEMPADGRMRAPHAAARDLLRDRLRHAEVLPCGPEWLVLRPLEPTETPLSTDLRETVAAGVIGEQGLSLVDFLGFLETADESGVLTVAHGAERRALFLTEGAVVGASSTSERDALGRFLVKRGAVTAEQLQQVERGDGGRVASEIVSRGLMTPEALSRALHAHIVEVFDRLLTATSGVWSFARLPMAELEAAPLQISIQGMLMDALRRLDEMQVFRQRLRSPDVIVQRVTSHAGHTADLVAGLEPAVQPDAARLLDVLEAPAALLDLEFAMGASEYQVTRAAYQLLRADLVQIVVPGPTREAPKRPTVAPEAAREMTHVYSIAVREIFEEVAHLGQSPQLRAAARDFLADEAGTSNYAQLLRNVSVQSDGTLDEESVLRGVSRSAVTTDALYESLGELLFFLLYQATELLGRRRGDDLARRVKMIHGMLPYGRKG